MGGKEAQVNGFYEGEIGKTLYERGKNHITEFTSGLLELFETSSMLEIILAPLLSHPSFNPNPSLN